MLFTREVLLSIVLTSGQRCVGRLTANKAGWRMRDKREVSWYRLPVFDASQRTHCESGEANDEGDELHRNCFY